MRPRASASDQLPQYEKALSTLADTGMIESKLVEHFESGLDAPICLTWELTYACNLACVHCLSSSRAPRPARADHRRVPRR